jgi:hypothetical protein
VNRARPRQLDHGGGGPDAGHLGGQLDQQQERDHPGAGDQHRGGDERAWAQEENGVSPPRPRWRLGPGLDLAAITAQLEREGVSSFCDSYHQLLDCIERKLAAVGAPSGR